MHYSIFFIQEVSSINSKRNTVMTNDGRRSRSQSPNRGDIQRQTEVREQRDQSPSSSSMSARDRNLIGMGVNPHEYQRQRSDQQNNSSSDSSDSESEMSQEQREQRRDLLRKARAGDTEARDQLRQEQHQAIERAATQQGMTVQEYRRHHQRQAIERAATQRGMTVQEYQRHRQRQAIEQRNLTSQAETFTGIISEFAQHQTMGQRGLISQTQRLETNTEQQTQTVPENTLQQIQDMIERQEDVNRMNNIRQQLGINTTPERWGQFASEIQVDMEENGFRDSLGNVTSINFMDAMMIGDILQGRANIQTTNEQRNSERYKELKDEVVKRWNDRNNTTNT
jgi:hypothetical protein